MAYKEGTRVGISIREMSTIVQILILIDLILSLLFVADYAIGRPFYKITDLLDLDSELSVANWYSSVKYFILFTLLAIISYYSYLKNKTSISLFMLPLLFLLMSIDESAHIHEYIGWQLDALLPEGSRENTIFSVTGIWMIVIGIPFILIFAWVAYSVKDFLKDSKFNFKLFIVGMVVLLTGAIGVEALSNFVEGGLLVMQITVEEGLEMLGVTIMIWSAYGLAMENLAHLLNFGPESNLFKQ